jgi:hypothetical protein
MCRRCGQPLTDHFVIEFGEINRWPEVEEGYDTMVFLCATEEGQEHFNVLLRRFSFVKDEEHELRDTRTDASPA